MGRTGDIVYISRVWQHHMARSDASSYPLEELRHAERRHDVELVLARALNAELARAIFKAATSEHPERRITLRKVNSIIADSLG